MSKQTASNVVKQFRVSSIWVTIYAKEALSGRGKYTQYTTRIERHWKDEKGHWCTTNFFLPQCLPELALAASKAYEFVTLRELEGVTDRQQAPAGDDDRDLAEQAEPGRS
jgi:hypothetical protein